MTYYFAGHERWSWVFDSPNEFGAVVAACVAAGIFAATATKNRAVFVCGCLVAGALAYIQGRSYSRSALAGVVVAILLCYPLLKPPGRKLIWPIAGCVFAILLFVPTYSARISPAYVQNDLSIWNRLSVWGGVCELVSDNPQGVGHEGFLFAFNQGYKSERLDSNYKSAVNTFLTIGAKYGLIALFIVLTFLLSLATLTIAGVRSNQGSPIGLPLLGAQIVFICGAVFNTFYLKSALMVCWGTVALFTILTIRADRRSWSEVGKCVWLSSVAAAVVIVIVMTIGAVKARITDHSGIFVLSDPKDGQVVRLSAKPRASHPENAADWVLIVKSNVIWDEDFQNQFRTLIKADHPTDAQIHVLFVRSSDKTSVEETAAAIRNLCGSRRWYCIGLDRAAWMAPYLARTGGAQAVVLINPEWFYPIAELAPKPNVDALKVPILLINDVADQGSPFPLPDHNPGNMAYRSIKVLRTEGMGSMLETRNWLGHIQSPPQL